MSLEELKSLQDNKKLLADQLIKEKEFASMYETISKLKEEVKELACKSFFYQYS